MEFVSFLDVIQRIKTALFFPPPTKLLFVFR